MLVLPYETRSSRRGIGRKLNRGLSLPPQLLLREASWRTGWALVRHATRHRDLRRGPSSADGGTAVEPFLLGANRARLVEPSFEDLDACLEEAGIALQGRFRILGHGTVEFGWPPQWHRDPTSGEAWGLVHHTAIRPLLGCADIKVPWEASRMHWLVALARAWRYRGDVEHRQGAVELLHRWSAANPTGWGPNWSNAMEAGIRTANLVWASEIFGDTVISRVVGGLVREHGRFIVENLEYSPSLTSNHFLADVVGLLYAGGALRRTASGRWWLRLAAHALQREVLKQFYEDGVNFEGSTCYHRLATELALFGFLACTRLGIPIGARVRSRFALALDALEAMAKADGRVPAIGDDDSGTVCNLRSGRHPREVVSVVGAGRSLLGSPGPVADARDEFQEWFAGSSRLKRSVPIARAMPEGKLFVLAAGDLWSLVDCGGPGQNGNGGHAHSDMLSFVLAYKGHEIITDPGTFLYTRDPRSRDVFRSTFVHATVAVDGESQHRFDRSIFSMEGAGEPVVEAWDAEPRRQQLIAHHDAYRDLPDPVRHRRCFTLDAEHLMVDDELDCAGRHTAWVGFPLALGCSATRDGAHWVIQKEGVSLLLRQREGRPIALEPADLLVSELYGAAAPSVILQGRFPVAGPTQWSFEIVPLRGDRR